MIWYHLSPNKWYITTLNLSLNGGNNFIIYNNNYSSFWYILSNSTSQLFKCDSKIDYLAIQLFYYRHKYIPIAHSELEKFLFTFHFYPIWFYSWKLNDLLENLHLLFETLTLKVQLHYYHPSVLKTPKSSILQNRWWSQQMMGRE